MTALYIVRHIYDKQAVGIYWAEDLDDLCEMVDAATDVVLCEFKRVDGSGGLMWESKCAGFGTFRDFDTIAIPGATPHDPSISIGDKEVADLMGEATPIGALEDFFYEEVDDWQILVPGDHPRDPEALAKVRQIAWDQMAAAADGLPGANPQPAAEPKKAPLVIPINVYFIGCGDHVKIGMTEGPVERRLKSLATAHHQELTLLAVVANAAGTLELELHERFAQYRVRGEWFTLSPEIQAYIDEIKSK